MTEPPSENSSGSQLELSDITTLLTPEVEDDDSSNHHTDSTSTDTGKKGRNINLSAPTAQWLNQRQKVVFSDHLTEYYRWMIEKGKHPDEKIGYAVSTAEKKLSRCDQLFRYIWNAENTVSLQLNSEQLNTVCEAIKEDAMVKSTGDAYSIASKRKLTDAAQTYANFLHDEKGMDEWEKPYQYQSISHRQPDEFSVQERKQLREAALRLDTLPTYSDATPSQRSKIKEYLSQAYGVSIDEVTPDFWQQHNQSWEIPSLVYTSLDAGLRPAEVSRFTVDWLRLDKETFFIPKDDATKNRENWKVAVRSDTAKILRYWIQERDHREKYDGRDELWLTRERNPWSSDSLNYLLRRLCDKADIDTTNRKIVWTSIRHSLGEHLTETGGISQAREQLRHKSIETTLRYTHPSAENRRDSLDQIG